ncbi:Lmo0850 family protein [Peribacillus loiseleuriae]|uniref:Lmo0850 family protein n=1 Tax=Peribacillus loiseleuriae TaxID=1679170 RepID=UPI003D03C86C
MVNHCILKFRSKGIKIAKTKSRHDIFSNLYEVDPSLLDLSTQEVQSSQSKQ